MLQRLLLALFCSFTFLSIAQNLNWQWGELTRSKGQLISIMTDQNQQFSTIHATNQLGSAGFQLTQFEQLNPVIGTRVKPVSPEGYGYSSKPCGQHNSTSFLLPTATVKK